jgi:drug/metabolite transporter (DMT)-like permease
VPADVFHFLLRAFVTETFWLGIASLFIFFVAYILVLSWADYSYVQPASALSYSLITLLAYLMLHEKITPTRWTGMLLICFGVFVVGHTQQRTRERDSC